MRNRLIAVLLAFIACAWAPVAYAGTTERYPGRICYAVGTAAFASAAAATNIFTLYGSATRKILISHIEITGTQTTAGQVLIQLVKYSTAVSGGTAVAATSVPLNALSVASTATNVAAYTANPTVGTAVGKLKSQHFFVPAPATANGTGNVVLWDELGYGEPIQLNSASEGIGIDLVGATVTGGSFAVSVQYEEIQ